ncbi:MAG: hypothetical protein ACRD25_13500 [Terracidiphilus sp.]
MTHEPPRDTDAEIGMDFSSEISDSEAVAESARAVEHHCQVCPNCGQRLTGHRCKLVCGGCGYYMSCADYY